MRAAVADAVPECRQDADDHEDEHEVEESHDGPGEERDVFLGLHEDDGQGISARLTTGRPLGTLEKLVFTLRCIEERTETRRTTRGSTASQTQCDQVWAEVVTLQKSWALNEGEIPISFHLPEGDLGTRLTEAPARYWEIEVTADTLGLDYGAVFPVPVYARPRA